MLVACLQGVSLNVNEAMTFEILFWNLWLRFYGIKSGNVLYYNKERFDTIKKKSR